MGWTASAPARCGRRQTPHRRPPIDKIATISLDIAKHVFQVHGIDASGSVGIRRRLRRSKVVAFFAKLPSPVIGMEACVTSHYWARELWHSVKLMPRNTGTNRVYYIYPIVNCVQ